MPRQMSWIYLLLTKRPKQLTHSGRPPALELHPRAKDEGAHRCNPRQPLQTLRRGAEGLLESPRRQSGAAAFCADVCRDACAPFPARLLHQANHPRVDCIG
jgi:hypothetical protein